MPKMLTVSDDEVAELNSLIQEVNQIDTLTLKHSTVNKILSLLCEKSSSEQSIHEKVQQSQANKMQFKSKLKLELKSMRVDPIVNQLIQSVLSQLAALVAERDSEIEEAMDEQAELRFKSCMDVKKKFNLKIAFAQKSGSLEDVKDL